MRLTALEPEDLELLYEIENDPALWSVGGAHVPFSRYDLKEYILGQQHDLYADRQLRLAIRVTAPSLIEPSANKKKGPRKARAGGESSVGLIDLFNFSPENMRAELGLAILPEEQGRGYAGEALRLMLDYCRDTLHLHQVYCTVPDDNKASLAMLRSAGFTDEVTLPQWLRTPSGWQDCRQLFCCLNRFTNPSLTPSLRGRAGERPSGE